jgi:hypothetical protein
MSTPIKPVVSKVYVEEDFLLYNKRINFVIDWLEDGNLINQETRSATLSEEVLMSYPKDVLAKFIVESISEMNKDIAKAVGSELIKMMNLSGCEYEIDGCNCGGLISGASATTSDSNFIPPFSSSDSSFSRLSNSLPAMFVKVKHPVGGKQTIIKDIIMDLNDHYKWPREKIADWLDEISDPTGENGPDIRFSDKTYIEKEESNEQD